MPKKTKWVTKFDHAAAIKLRGELLPWLRDAERDLGVSIQMGVGSYSANGIEFRIRMSRHDEAGNAMTRERSDWERDCERFGFTEADLDREFVSKSRRYRIIGINRRKRKFPILVVCLANGNQSWWNADAVKEARIATIKMDCTRQHPHPGCQCDACKAARKPRSDYLKLADVIMNLPSPRATPPEWLSGVPACLVGDVDDARTLEEAVSLAETQLDLIREGQDGTEHYTKTNVRQIEKWIRSNKSKKE